MFSVNLPQTINAMRHAGYAVPTRHADRVQYMLTTLTDMESGDAHAIFDNYHPGLYAGQTIGCDVGGGNYVLIWTDPLMLPTVVDAQHFAELRQARHL